MVSLTPDKARPKAGVSGTPQGWRWRCALCPAFGLAGSDRESTEDFERHYFTAHLTKEAA